MMVGELDEESDNQDKKSSYAFGLQSDYEVRDVSLLKKDSAWTST